MEKKAVAYITKAIRIRANFEDIDGGEEEDLLNKFQTIVDNNIVLKRYRGSDVLSNIIIMMEDYLYDEEGIRKEDFKNGISDLVDDETLIRQIVSAIDEKPLENIDNDSYNNRLSSLYFDIELMESITQLDKLKYRLTKTNNRKERINILKELYEVAEKLEVEDVEDDGDTVVVGSDIEAMAKNFVDLDEENEGLIYKTGFKAFNIALQGGYKVGDIIGICADSHMYKTGMTISTLLSIALFNKAPELDDGRKPALALYSLEDPLNNAYNFIFKMFYFYEHEKTYRGKLTSLEKAKYINDKVSENGWEIVYLKSDPTTIRWNYPMKRLDKMASRRNLYIIFTAIDYIPLLSLTEMNGSGGTELRDLIRRWRNYGIKRKMGIFTPLQAAPAVLSLEQEGYDKFERVKVMARRRMTSGSRQLVQDLDVLIFVDKVAYEKKSFLTVIVEKHKNPNVISNYDKKFIMKFEKGTGVPYDMGKEKAFWRTEEDLPTFHNDDNSSLI